MNPLSYIRTFVSILFLLAATSAQGFEKPNPAAPFEKAIEALDAEAIAKVLDAGADPNARYNGTGHCILEMVQTRFAFQFVFDEKADRREVEKRVINVIDVLLKRGARINEMLDPLSIPAYEGATELGAYLIKNGAVPDGNEDNSKGRQRPLYHAIRNGHQSFEELLITNGARKYSNSEVLQIKLAAAAHKGDLGALRLAIKAGANVNLPDCNGRSALFDAARAGKWDAMIYLLDNGAQPNLAAKDSFGTQTTALHVAVFVASRAAKGRGIIEGPPVDAIDALLKKGALVSSSKDRDGRTPLHIAAEYGCTSIATILLNAGAKVMPKDAKGRTPLDYAESGPMIKLLKENGASE